MIVVIITIVIVSLKNNNQSHNNRKKMIIITIIINLTTIAKKMIITTKKTHIQNTTQNRNYHMFMCGCIHAGSCAYTYTAALCICEPNRCQERVHQLRTYVVFRRPVGAFMCFSLYIAMKTVLFMIMSIRGVWKVCGCVYVFMLMSFPLHIAMKTVLFVVFGRFVGAYMCLCFMSFPLHIAMKTALFMIMSIRGVWKVCGCVYMCLCLCRFLRIIAMKTALLKTALFDYEHA
jgi:hypothetical protein